MKNHILSALDQQDYALIAPHLQPCKLKARQELETANRPIKFIYFIETGFAAVLSIAKGLRVAVGLIGLEGASGISVFLGDALSPHSTMMLCDGSAQRISASAVQAVMDHQPEARRIFLRYSIAVYNQAAHTNLSNALSEIEQRVARWLLMSHDRVPKNRIPLTHDVIASIIGIRRAGVTEALDRFEKLGLIELERGATTIIDRPAIERLAGPFYGFPEKEFVRLIGT